VDRRQIGHLDPRVRELREEVDAHVADEHAEVDVGRIDRDATDARQLEEVGQQVLHVER
jgi:hypothetical protein